MDVYQPGSYDITIRGTSGVTTFVTADTAIQLNLIDPCLSAKLTALTPSFDPVDYMLGDPKVSRTFFSSEIVSSDVTDVDCGPITVELIDEDGQELNPAVFQYDRIAALSAQDEMTHVLYVDEQSDASTVGEQLVYFLVALANYPQVKPVSGQLTTVTIVEPENVRPVYEYIPEPDWFKALTNRTIFAGESFNYQLRSQLNSNDPPNTYLKVTRGSTFRFTKFDAKDNILSVNSDLNTELDVGAWPIKVELMKDARFTGVPAVLFSKWITINIKSNGLPEEQPLNPDLPSQETIEVDKLSEFEGLVYLEPQDLIADRPVPYIASVSPTGVIKIGWDRPMRPVENPQIISPTEVAVSEEILEAEQNKDNLEARFGRSRSRSLEVLWNDSIRDEGNEQVYLYLLKALDVQLVRNNKDKPGKELISDFEWDVIGYDTDFIWLQIDFENPGDVGFTYLQDQLSVTFYGTEYFMSVEGLEVEFGNEVRGPI